MMNAERRILKDWRDSVKSAVAILAPAFAVLLLNCGPIPPYVIQEGRTAELTRTLLPEVQAGASYDIWQHDRAAEKEWYFLGGAYTGQKLGKFGFEEGLVASGFRTWNIGLAAAFGLRNPSIALRGSYYPLSIYPGSVWRAYFNPLHGWWQASLLGGYRFRPDRVGTSAGAIASPYGWGPTLTADYRIGRFALRGQGSVTFKSPWAPARVAGRLITLGLTAACITD